MNDVEYKKILNRIAIYIHEKLTKKENITQAMEILMIMVEPYQDEEYLKEIEELRREYLDE